MSPEILVVDDDRKTVDLIRLYLERAGYQVCTAHDGPQALALAEARAPALIVLDLMLPHLDGLDVCRALRQVSAVPIILLTARTTEEDKLLGLDLGADDYVTKPFSPRELVARVRAVLRRAGEEERGEPTLRYGDLTVDPGRHEVWMGGEVVPLTPKEFRLLHTLVRAPGQVFSRLDLLERAFGHDYDGLERTIDVHISSLRRKLEREPGQAGTIVTVYGVGYTFAPPDEVGHAAARS